MAYLRKRSGRAAAVPGAASATVPRNDWRLLEAANGASAPALEACVVLEGETSDEARRAAEALSSPAGLTVVTDAAEAPESAAVVIFLPGRAVPSPGFVEAHLSRHTAAGDLAVVGPVRAANPAPGEQDPFDVVADLTRGLTDPSGAFHLAAALGSLSVRAETLAAAGGPGMGDHARLDLAARLDALGCVFVPEPAAVATSPGRPPAADLVDALVAQISDRTPFEISRPVEAGLVGRPPFRPAAPARRRTRPAVVVNLEVGEGESEDEVLATLGPILRGRLGDLELRVQIADDHAAREAVAERLIGDTRASIAPSSLESFCASPFQALIPAAALPDERTLADLARLMVEEDAGAIHCTVPGAPPQDAMIEVFASGARARSARVAAETGRDPDEVLGELFGERWVSGVEVSVRAHGVLEPHVTEHGPLAAATDPEHERTQHLRFRDRADDLEQRASVLARRTLAERLESRRTRLRADELAERLEGAGSPPRFWRLHPLRRASAAVRSKLRR